MSSKKFYFIMLGVMGLSIAVSVAGFYWVNQQLSHKSSQVAVLLAERDAEDDTVAKLKQAQISAKNAAELQGIIDAMLPKQKQQDTLVADIIYTATSEAGVAASQILNITFTGTGVPDKLSGTSASKDVQGVYVYPFTLQLKDISYATMLKLFSEFEKNKRIIQTDQVQITPDRVRIGFLSSVSLSLRTFVQP